MQFFDKQESVLNSCCFLVAMAMLLVAHSPAWAQINDGELIVSEFFEELYRVDVSSGTAVDILDSTNGQGPFGQLVEVLDSSTIIVSDFDDLYRYDTGSQTANYWTTLPFNPAEITRDRNGNLIAVGTDGVFRVDGVSGNSSLIHDQTFFGVDDAIVDDNGNIFVTEFFEGLGVVGSQGGYTKIGDFDANEFAHVEIGVDGQLYLATTFDAEFWRVDPNSGAGTLLGADLWTFMDDVQADQDGNLLFSGVVDSVNGVFHFDTTTGVTTTIIDGDDYNGGFWNGLDLDLYESSLRFSSRVAVPEPTVSVVAFLGLALLRRRRRSTL